MGTAEGMMWKEGWFSIFPRHLFGKSFFSRDSGNRVDTFSESCGRFSIAMLLEGGISTSTAGLSENARGKSIQRRSFFGVFSDMRTYRAVRGLGVAALRFGRFSRDASIGPPHRFVCQSDTLCTEEALSYTYI